jgi:hypothetical protein
VQNYIQSPSKSWRLQLLISWVLDELEKRCFRHLTLNGQDFFNLQYQILATSGLSPAGRQSRDIFAAHFFGEKIPPRLSLDNF